MDKEEKKVLLNGLTLLNQDELFHLKLVFISKKMYERGLIGNPLFCDLVDHEEMRDFVSSLDDYIIRVAPTQFKIIELMKSYEEVTCGFFEDCFPEGICSELFWDEKNELGSIDTITEYFFQNEDKFEQCAGEYLHDCYSVPNVYDIVRGELYKDYIYAKKEWKIIVYDSLLLTAMPPSLWDLE